MKELAVVLGPSTYHTLGVVRSCGECGMPVVLLLTTEEQSVRISRSRYVLESKNIECHSASIIEEITEIKNRHSPVKMGIIPTGDAESLILDGIGGNLDADVFTPGAGGNMEYLMDKYNMVLLAKECDLKVPESRFLDLRHDERKHPQCFPVILKPRASVLGRKSDIAVCRDAQEYDRACQQFKNNACYDVLEQAFVNRGKIEEIAVPGVCVDGQDTLVAGVVHKRRISGNGSTCFADFSPAIDDLPIASIRKFIIRSRYQGIFDIEFLKVDGNYYFIECNYRNGAYGYAVSRAGINLPALWITKLRKGIGDARPVTFMEERSDIFHMLNGELSLCRWLKDVLSCHVLLTYQFRDIMPLLRVPHFVKKIFS